MRDELPAAKLRSTRCNNTTSDNSEYKLWAISYEEYTKRLSFLFGFLCNNSLDR